MKYLSAATNQVIRKQFRDQTQHRRVLQDGVPIGGLSVGGADGLAALGMLRPYIRHHDSRNLPYLLC